MLASSGTAPRVRPWGRRTPPKRSWGHRSRPPRVVSAHPDVGGRCAKAATLARIELRPGEVVVCPNMPSRVQAARPWRRSLLRQDGDLGADGSSPRRRWRPPLTLSRDASAQPWRVGGHGAKAATLARIELRPGEVGVTVHGVARRVSAPRRVGGRCAKAATLARPHRARRKAIREPRGASRVTGNAARGTGHGLRATGNGQRATGNGLRATGYGLRATGYGQRATGNGQRATGNGQRPTAHRPVRIRA
jgi:hypothetical protein